MIGQKGVAKGKAIELAEAKGNRDFASAAKITGCTDFPCKQAVLNSNRTFKN